jgi:uncharacterized membrane protein YfhO
MTEIRMKKFKLVLWLVIIAFFALFFYQNQTYFMSRHGLSLKLPFLEMYHLPELPNAILFLAFLLLGLLIAYFFSLLERFRSNKTIKGLNATVDTNLDTISSLRREVDALKGSGSIDAGKPAEAKTDLSKPDDGKKETEPKA